MKTKITIIVTLSVMALWILVGCFVYIKQAPPAAGSAATITPASQPSSVSAPVQNCVGELAKYPHACDK